VRDRSAFISSVSLHLRQHRARLSSYLDLNNMALSFQQTIIWDRSRPFTVEIMQGSHEKTAYYLHNALSSTPWPVLTDWQVLSVHSLKHADLIGLLRPKGNKQASRVSLRLVDPCQR